MSDSYRDDTMEIAMMSNEIWTTVYEMVEDRARASEKITLKIGLMVADTAHASDVITGHRGFLNTETAHASETVLAYRQIPYSIVNTARLKGFPYLKFSVLVEDQAVIDDEFFGGAGIFLTEHAKARISLNAVRQVSRQISELARLKDRFFEKHSILLIETATLKDTAYHRYLATERVTDQVQMTDSLLIESSATNWITDTARANNQVSGALLAVFQANERGFAYDQVLDLEPVASAWVANSDSWAMSRYAPYNFEGAAVINGELYLYNHNGVYLSGVEGEEINARLVTGKLDFSEGLVHPLAYFMEYQLSGENKALSIKVGTTQSGNLQQYTYHLSAEKADYLTNGRVQFGRGLRGRHFSFEIQMQGTSAVLHSQSVEFAQTARRI